MRGDVLILWVGRMLSLCLWLTRFTSESASGRFGKSGHPFDRELRSRLRATFKPDLFGKCGRFYIWTRRALRGSDSPAHCLRASYLVRQKRRALLPLPLLAGPASRQGRCADTFPQRPTQQNAPCEFWNDGKATEAIQSVVQSVSNARSRGAKRR